MRLLITGSLLLSLGLVSGCGKSTSEPTPVTATSSRTTQTPNLPPVPPPLPADADAVKVAEARALPARKGTDAHGLHNVFRLSENIVSGSEPHGDEALEDLHAMGVKTIISVDGKVPDFEGAKKLGMQYVHVPIQYKGINDKQAAKLVKAFRELPKPIYVHCFHGKHRGPAAAALGRLAVDGAPRDLALAEMLQWCGTSKGYPGLFGTVAHLDLPSPEATAALPVDFNAEGALAGFASTMVLVSRAEDALKDLASRDFRPDPDHPDIDARQEARSLAAAFRASSSAADLGDYPAAMPPLLGTSVKHTDELVEALDPAKLASPEGLAAAKAKVAAVQKDCKGCHSLYRDH